MLFWVCKMYTRTLNGIVFLVTGKFFPKNRMKTRQENVDFKLGLANLRCVFAKLLMYEHYSYKKDVCMEFINGIDHEGMNVVYSSQLCLVL